MDGFDLNLLRTLDVLLRERNVSRAAARLGLSQSAMSASLARLRAAFDDRLLVRRGREMVLTPHAELLREHVAEVVCAASRLLALDPAFEPSTARRTFTIMTSDYAALVVVPALLARLRTRAPGVSVDVLPLRDDLADALRRGAVDVLLISESIRRKDVPDTARRPLFTDRFVCARWREHPTVSGDIDAAQLSALPYVEYRPGGLTSAVDRELDERRIPRTVVARAESQLLVPHLLRGGPLISIMPEQVALLAESAAQIRWSPCPVPLPPIEQTAAWDARRADDLALGWLIDQLCAA
ncbi:LysR family transcriptional regulator [Pseudonocardia acaciae]|uniref:LysR family transcriptional regulator n=1 Tax=Pseudonocardia acaciae TaxID=551276 RepID=UPI0006882E58|nr:LysR family transcriptional regulator [Pseudonocardia acaciae]